MNFQNMQLSSLFVKLSLEFHLQSFLNLLVNFKIRKINFKNLTFLIFAAIIIVLILLFVFIWFLDGMILIIIGVKIFSISRRLVYSEHARFDEHQKWYWICVKFYCIMLVTVPYEIFILTSKFNLFFLMMANFINVFTAIIISITLLGRKKVKILMFGKYSKIYNQETK